MSSPFWSALQELDSSLQAVQSQVNGLRASLEVNDDQLAHSVKDAWHHGVQLRDLIRAERPDANWNDREALQQLIRELEVAAEVRRNQQRRSKLLDLASELDAGRVQHRRDTRSRALNRSRLQAVAELRAEAARSKQVKEVPGPKASEWLPWACTLQDGKDAPALVALRRDFPVVEHFIGEMEESYWIPGHLVPENPPQAAPPSVRTTKEAAVVTPAAARPKPAATVSNAQDALARSARAQFDSEMAPAKWATIRFVDQTPTIRENGELVWNFINEGSVSAKGVIITLSVKYLSIPTGRPIDNTTMHFTHRFAAIPPSLHLEGRTPYFADAIFHIPSREWQRFRDTDLVVSVKGTLRYENGFSEAVEEPLCYYGLAWECWVPADNKMRLRPTLYRCDSGMTIENALNCALEDKCLQLETASQPAK